jgi:hypothetical protein
LGRQEVKEEKEKEKGWRVEKEAEEKEKGQNEKKTERKVPGELHLLVGY